MQKGKGGEASKECQYEAICSMGRLIEKEVEIFKMIHSFIRKFQRKQSKTLIKEMQITDLFSAVDQSNKGRLSQKQ